jgi:hypothetical protein
MIVEHRDDTLVAGALAAFVNILIPTSFSPIR